MSRSAYFYFWFSNSIYRISGFIDRLAIDVIVSVEIRASFQFIIEIYLLLYYFGCSNLQQIINTVEIEFTWACVAFNAPWNRIKFTARLKWKLFLFWNYVNSYLVYMYLYKNLCVLVHCMKILIWTRGKKIQ